MTPLLIFSVGGGSSERNVSVILVRAIAYAREKGLKIFGVVGRDGGDAKRRGDAVLVVLTVDEALVTPHTEAFQAVIWRAMVCHPKLMARENKWEGLSKA